MYVPAKNPTDAPVVIDFEGRVLGGGEWGVVDRHDDAAEAAIADGRLVLYPSGVKAGPDVEPDAVSATELAQVLEDRRRHFTALEVDDLRDHAAEVDLLQFRAQAGADHRELYDERDKAELVRLLARRVEVPLTTTAEASDATAPTVPSTPDSADDAGDTPAKAARTAKKAGGRQ